VRKGFVAAPLLGTIIFLASILFVVNLSKAEAGEIALISSDAYHNRIVSMLEVYRTDLGSQFRENLSRVIEDFLTSECWVNLFKISNLDDGGNPLTLEEARFAGCERVTDTIHQVICSLPKNVEEQGGVEEGDRRTYGLPQWMEQIAQPFTFEGIKFTIANPEQFRVFYEYSDDYVANCVQLLEGSMFDCEAFAEDGVFQCIDGDKIIPGCEEGNFFVKVKILDQDIYPKLPRVLSADATGNEVRSGAVSDADFYLPINYPLFKYYDYAFGAYNELAYGQDSGGSQVSGVIKGFCAEESDGDCEYADKYADEGFPANGDNVQIAARDAFYGNAFTQACVKYSSPEEELNAVLEEPYQETLHGTGEGFRGDDLILLEACATSPCSASSAEGWVNCTASSAEDFLPDAFNIEDEQCGGDDDSQATDARCAFIDSYAGGAHKMRFIDYDFRLQVKPDAPNQFCWVGTPVHDPAVT